ncbi:ABC transporter substrate-binding protein [Ramlibacter sp. WS9]|uniref:ABC transporter substrate-binding protein n=1 Tax=Ramlibacter sp. WS9 TaxID=1882741 RepID=UPI0011416317|nr:ABC transporter substrate-binding protein [Ramlibacter sp. WS9]ROZ64187.1 ABC transporter substrate-binding protein [Ramlibacter sp. WS9]
MNYKLLASLAAALCIGPALAQPQAGLLRVHSKADIRSTDPGSANRDSVTDGVLMHVVEGLVAYREDASIGPMLAQSYQMSPDGRTYTFKLRQGVKFSNGAPLTADDVLFAWKRYMTPANNWRCLSEFDGRGVAKVTAVEAPDSATVVFKLEKTSALFLTTMARSDCGSTGIFHRSSLDAEGKWKEPVGTGPFKMGEWRRGQFVELVRNDAYSGMPGKIDGTTGNKAPQVAKVRFVIIPDSSAAKAALLSGGIDIIPDINDEDMAEYKARKEIVMDPAANMNAQGLLFQTRDPLLKDARIRRAIALSLDMPELVATVTTGTAKPSRSVMPSPSSYYKTAQAALPKRDLAQAKKLLAEAGYKGQTIKILATKRYNSVFNIAMMVQGMAQEAGIKIDVEVLEWATLLDRYNKGDYQAMAFTYSARLDPSLSYEMISGDKDKQPRKVWDNPEALELIQRSMNTTDRVQRQAIFDKLEGKMREDVPAIFMYASVNTSAARNYVAGYKSWPLGLPRLWGVSMRTP